MHLSAVLFCGRAVRIFSHAAKPHVQKQLRRSRMYRSSCSTAATNQYTQKYTKIHSNTTPITTKSIKLKYNFFMNHYCNRKNFQNLTKIFWFFVGNIEMTTIWLLLRWRLSMNRHHGGGPIMGPKRVNFPWNFCEFSRNFVEFPGKLLTLHYVKHANTIFIKKI